MCRPGSVMSLVIEFRQDAMWFEYRFTDVRRVSVCIRITRSWLYTSLLWLWLTWIVGLFNPVRRVCLPPPLDVSAGARLSICLPASWLYIYQQSSSSQSVSHTLYTNHRTIKSTSSVQWRSRISWRVLSHIEGWQRHCWQSFTQCTTRCMMFHVMHGCPTNICLRPTV